MIVKCNGACATESTKGLAAQYQDEHYAGLRVHTTHPDGSPSKCTVCGTRNAATGVSKKGTSKDAPL